MSAPIPQVESLAGVSLSVDLATDSEAEEAHKSRFLQLLDATSPQLDLEDNSLPLSDDIASSASSFANLSESTGFSPTLKAERAAHSLLSSKDDAGRHGARSAVEDMPRDLRKSVTWCPELGHSEEQGGSPSISPPASTGTSSHHASHTEKRTQAPGTSSHCASHTEEWIQAPVRESRTIHERASSAPRCEQAELNKQKQIEAGEAQSEYPDALDQSLRCNKGGLFSKSSESAEVGNSTGGCGGGGHAERQGQVGFAEPVLGLSSELLSAEKTGLQGVTSPQMLEDPHPPEMRMENVERRDASPEGSRSSQSSQKGNQSQSSSIDIMSRGREFSELLRVSTAPGIAVEGELRQRTFMGAYGVGTNIDELAPQVQQDSASECLSGLETNVAGSKEGGRRAVVSSSRSQRGTRTGIEDGLRDEQGLAGACAFSQGLLQDQTKNLNTGGVLEPSNRNAPQDAADKYEVGGGRGRTGSSHADPHGRVAAHRIAELTRKVEELRQQVIEEKLQRQAATQSLAEQRREADRNLKRMRETWEAKLREVQKEKYSLSIRVQELEVLNPRQKVRRGLVAAAEEVHLTAEELQTLRQEIQEQETLLQGYQKENEKMAERIKEVQAEGKERMALMAEENARLAAQVVSVQAMEGQRATDGAATLHRVLALESELQLVKQAAQARELDLKFELDKARQGKRELETRMVGLDPVKMVEEDTELAEVRAELAKERAAHAHLVAELEGKLAWYAENQDILDNMHTAMEAQHATITELRNQLAAYEGAAGADVDMSGRGKNSLQAAGADEQMVGGARVSATGKGVKANDGNARAGARIRALERQVRSLQEALKSASKDPNSLAFLIETSKPSAEESEVVRGLREQVSRLQQQCENKEEEAGRALRSLRQEHERIKREYEARLRAAKQMGTSSAPSGTGAQERPSAARLRQLERNLEEVRTFYQKKVKDLTKKLQDALKGPTGDAGERRQDSNEKQPNGGAKLALLKVKEELARANEKITRLQDILAHKETVLKGLHLRLGDVEEGGSEGTGQERGQWQRGAMHRERLLTDNGAHEGTSDKIASVTLDGEKQMLALSLAQAERRCEELTATVAELQEMNKGLQLGAGVGVSPAPMLEEVMDLRRQVVALRMERDVAQKACSEALLRVAAMHVHVEHGGAMVQEQEQAQTSHPPPPHVTTLSTDGGGGEKEERKEASEGAVQNWEDMYAAAMSERDAMLARIQLLSAQLQQLSHLSHSSQSPQWHALERKILEMEARQREREEQWRSVVAETKRICGMEADMLQSKWELAMEAKNGQIQRFRHQLDAIIAAAQAIRNNNNNTQPHGTAAAG